MIDCLRTCVRKEPIIALYFEFETVLKFYNLEASTKLALMCLAQGHNAVTLASLEFAAPRSRIKHSTTEPLRSL